MKIIDEKNLTERRATNVNSSLVDEGDIEENTNPL
jgi:hypothetical protein